MRANSSKISTNSEKIAQIYLPDLPLFASLPLMSNERFFLKNVHQTGSMGVQNTLMKLTTFELKHNLMDIINICEILTKTAIYTDL